MMRRRRNICLYFNETQSLEKNQTLSFAYKLI